MLEGISANLFPETLGGASRPDVSAPPLGGYTDIAKSTQEDIKAAPSENRSQRQASDDQKISIIVTNDQKVLKKLWFNLSSKNKVVPKLNVDVAHGLAEFDRRRTSSNKNFKPKW